MEKITSNKNFTRIRVVDALRGFAVMSIMLLHNIEHFDYYYFPDYLPQWMKVLDGYVWNTMFALFSGKAYAIFAVLFGFTFFLMDSKQKALGQSFDVRFLLRMLWLLAFGVFNSMFYSGDVLAIYAVLGFTLVLVNVFKNKVVLIIAAILILQPIEISRLVYMVIHQEYTPGNPQSWHYFGLANTYLGGNSFLDTAWGNLTNGRWACTLWSWEHGRFFQIPALFMVGLILGRTRKFEYNSQNMTFWKNTLIISVITGVIILSISKTIPEKIQSDVLRNQLTLIIETWSNFTFTFVWISTFVLLYNTKVFNKLLSRLEVFGKMSLTNYVMQSMMGCFVYNGCGLALYQYTGATLSLMVGIVLFTIQYLFCKWWFKTHKQGPLEGIWHKLTWMGK